LIIWGTTPLAHRNAPSSTIVHQQVDSSKLADGRIDQPLHVLRVRHVGDVQCRLVADHADSLLGFATRGFRVHHHGRAARGERAADRAADVARAAGDQGDFAGQLVARPHAYVACQDFSSSG
jgi:hypothetical protein